MYTKLDAVYDAWDAYDAALDAYRAADAADAHVAAADAAWDAYGDYQSELKKTQEENTND